MHPRIYLDHAATTPLAPRVLEAMLPALTQNWGNPSSSYAEGRQARALLDRARRTVAELLNANPAEIIFTGGGSEADNLALRGIARAARGAGRGHRIVTSPIEHHAVLHTAQALARDGFDLTLLPVDREGFVDLAALEHAVDSETCLVSVMYANNEVGTIEPVAELARLAKARNPRTAVHTDAVQAAGLLDLDVERLGVDALSLAAHKFYGPRGIGVLYLRRGTVLEAQIQGGAQERERRAGTENVAGALGLAEALRLASADLADYREHCRRLRDRLLAELPRAVPGVHVTGPRSGERRLANNASFCIEGIEAETLLLQLDLAGIAASSGSACTTGSLEPSHVLLALGVAPELARGSLRLTAGRENGDADIDALLGLLPELVRRQRAAAAVGATATTA